MFVRTYVCLSLIYWHQPLNRGVESTYLYTYSCARCVVCTYVRTCVCVSLECGHPHLRYVYVCVCKSLCVCVYVREGKCAGLVNKTVEGVQQKKKGEFCNVWEGVFVRCTSDKHLWNLIIIYLHETQFFSYIQKTHSEGVCSCTKNGMYIWDEEEADPPPPPPPPLLFHGRASPKPYPL